MEIMFLIKGLVIGFLVAAPVGPVGVLCIKRTFSNGVLSGSATGLGAATADAFYGSIAAFSLTFISDFFSDHKMSIQIIGIFFLLYLGFKTFFDEHVERVSARITGESLVADYFTTLGLTLTNPTTIGSFAAIFAGIGISSDASTFQASLLVLGVFLGSVAWWLFLSNSIHLLRKRSNENLFKWINKISGVLTLIFALLLLINLFIY